MRPEDVPNELLLAFINAAMAAGKPVIIQVSAIRAALAAVAPEIAKAEREACARVVERIIITHPRQDGTRPFFSAAAAAAAIRARSTEDTTP